MQKLVNALAIVSFAVSAGVVASVSYVYINKDALLEQAKDYAFRQLPIPQLPELPISPPTDFSVPPAPFSI